MDRNSGKAARYARVLDQVQELIAETANPLARMATIAALLHHKMTGFSWTGFYLLDGEDLVVGPYQGLVACLVLERHAGVCWAGVDRNETVIVSDVHAFPGHIACDPRSVSEIVVPLRRKDGTVAGVLDLDSTRSGWFDPTATREGSSHSPRSCTRGCELERKRGRGLRRGLRQVPAVEESTTSRKKHSTEQRPDTRPPATPLQPGDAGRSRWLRVAAVLLLSVTVCFAVYGNALDGRFVYDDDKQIVRNTLIQDPRFFWTALASDVWAFKGSASDVVSNYWRPVFVLWLVANHRMFGLGSTVGWHVMHLALHALVTALCYAVARKLGLAWTVAGAVGFLFAVHPVHVEAVAWLAGAPDLLLSAALLGALALFLSSLERPSRLATAGAVALYGVGQLSKETAIFFPALVFLVAGWPEPGARGFRWKTAARKTAPFAAVAAGYALAHVAVVGATSIRAQGAAGPATSILTAPSLAAFYLRQLVLPFWIGPQHPIRPVLPAAVGFGNFVVPLVVVLAAAAFALRRARNDRTAAVGLALLALPLLPAFHLSVFLPEQIAHDRYLYLPLLGALLLFLPWAHDAATRAAGAATRWLAPSLAIGVGALLAALTIRYNPAWHDDLSLWAWAVRSDPGSAFAWSEYAVKLREAGRRNETREALDRTLAVAPVTSAYLLRAEMATEEGRFADAEADLKLVLRNFPDHDQAYERLAVCYERQRRLDDAEKILREARDKVPHRKCTFTDMLAVVLYQAGRKLDALAELESVRALVPSEYHPASRLVLYRLGTLYLELGRKPDAAGAFREFMERTKGLQDPVTLSTRAATQRALGAL